MSCLRRSTGSQRDPGAPLLLADELLLLLPSVPPLAGEYRPMTSHARMEGRASAPLTVAEEEKTLRQRRKAFLPQLSHAKAFMLHSECHEPQQRDCDGDDNGDDADPEDANHAANDVDTDAFKQAMWAGQANILVTVRLRPRLGHDRDNEEIVKVLDHKLVVVLDTATVGDSASHFSPARRHTSHPLRKLRHTSVVTAPVRRSREKRFAFDHVFTPEDGQQTVYCHTTKFLIHGVLNGFNATVFAYGCTGAGKTYTMLGTPDAPGIMARTLEDLFQNIARVHADPLAAVTYKVTVSFLEVYNENIRDLLVAPSGGSGGIATGGGAAGGGGGSAASEFLDLREDPVKGPVIAGISEIEACNAQDVMKLLRRGNKHRSQEATAANAVSSRSHAVLQVLVEQREKVSSGGASALERTDTDDTDSGDNAALNNGGSGDAMATVVKFGKLSLVDLAGSERAAVTQNRGQRLLEGANINRSLLALGNCINALGEKSKSAASGVSTTFVPYRDSKLTRLLKDSLGGNCRTVMIANVSLAAASLEETLNTLKYANRAKNIKTTVSRNVLSVDTHITEYVGVIATLRDEVATLKQQLARQQQQQFESVGRNPSQRTPRHASGAVAVPPATSSNNNNNNNESDDSSSCGDGRTPSTEQIQAQLRDVRAHIATYFVERLRLREVLLRADHQIEALAACSQVALTATDRLRTESASAVESDKVDTAASPEVDVTTASERNQEESSATLAMSVDANGDPTEPQPLDNDLDAYVRQREWVTRELARLETRIEDFRAAILASSTLLDHALFREVLMMEFRVGALEVERMELKLAHELRDTEIGRLRTHIGAPVQSTSESKQPATRLPLLHQLSSQCVAAPPCDRGGTDAGESSRRESPRAALGFIDDPRGRFQTLRVSHDDGALSASQQQQRAPHPTATSNYASATTSSSARRQWGLSLTSSALPYIRLKKKAPADNDDLSHLTASIGLSSGVSSQLFATSLSSVAVKTASPGASATAASACAGPYLRVLKHRRKSQHKAAASGHRK